MSLVNFTSGINKIEQSLPLSEWAAKFIQQNGISRENMGSTEAFRTLKRREKDAIRYQLRKPKTHRFQSPQQATPFRNSSRRSTYAEGLTVRKSGKLILGVWISGFLLIDIAQAYIAKGMGPVMAWQLALLVEVCILVASSSARSDVRKIAYLLFFYNALLFGFIELSQVTQKQNLNEEVAQLINGKKQQLESLKQKLNINSEESLKNIRHIDSLLSRGFVTSGSTAIEKISKRMDESNVLVTKLYTKTEAEIEQLNLKKVSLFSARATSLLYFFLRCFLQLFSILLLKRAKD